MKQSNISHRLSILLHILVVCILTHAGVGHISFANEPVEDEDQSTTDESPADEESEANEHEAIDADEELFKELQEFQLLLEENEESDRDYSDGERCVETRLMRTYQVLSQRFVALEMRQAGVFYLIQFDQRCPGLQQNGSLTFTMHNGKSGRLCVNDDILPLDNSFGSPAGAHSRCRIPSLEKITKVQLVQLNRGLVSKRVE